MIWRVSKFERPMTAMRGNTGESDGTRDSFVDGNRNVSTSTDATSRSPLFMGNKFNGNTLGMNIGSRALDDATISENQFNDNAFDGLVGGRFLQPCLIGDRIDEFVSVHVIAP